ncbi:MAG: hypothetical protein HY692_02590, partial [Cyanobacteria bacterium NC_groundwater_1444_Ag_S-0.65um_54_12]|nr:hypothetical protein [Cyanobacteria bacterium NC_groundwater_1444_Ag_S-0.65um_54_12]
MTRTTRSYHDMAINLHRQLLVIDGHADTLDRCLTEGVSLEKAQPLFHLDLPRIE